MMRAIAVIALVMAPIVAGAAQPEEKAAAYQAQMQPMSRIVAVAARAASCEVRSRQWNALIQGASVIQAYALAGALWGMQGKYLSPAGLVHFEKMGDALQRIRLAAARKTPDACASLRNDPSIMRSLDHLAVMEGWPER
ncbi:unnamed protein product [Acidocella sp. C78]|uniref:hypothetical protein n=1 Tax=Acidocella sp. C78 TaxID=1671486 RepID=UPI00191BA9C6|nr:hypothetical protein [Acidocella sp. C78]CAG4901028.1 unnamed protein product [Acidocella sp. C78]